MSEFKKLLFIVNKFSGTGSNPQLENLIGTTCQKYNTNFTIEYTASRGHATELAKNGEGNYDAIIAVGGDGTVNETSRGLILTSTPLGIIPTGSGNGLARHLTIPIQIEHALEALFNGTVMIIDTFMINDYHSINVSGIGFDGHVANLFGQPQKRGLWGYIRLVINEYLNYKEFNWELHSDFNSTDRRSFIIAIANSSQYGNNASIAPLASITDGQLNLSIINKVPLFKLPSFIFRMFTKNLGNNDMFESFTFRMLTIKSAVPLAFHIDGEPGGLSDSFVIKTLPASLKVIVPANQHLNKQSISKAISDVLQK